MNVVRGSLSAVVVALALAGCTSTNDADRAVSKDQVWTSIAGVIEMPGRGPELTWFWLESYPPQGGEMPLTNWAWDDIDDVESIQGTTWSNESFRIVGTWDGSMFTLTEEPVATDEQLFDVEYITPTEGCSEEEFFPLFEFTDTLDRAALGIVGGSEDVWDGRCGITIEASFDTPELRDAIKPIADRTTLFFRFSPVAD